MPEKDFVIARKKISDEIKEIDSSLTKLHSQESENAEYDDEFIGKASYFIMVQKLLDGRFVDYEQYIRNVNPIIPRNFVLSVVEIIVVRDGKVESITFKNGLTHTFSYK